MKHIARVFPRRTSMTLCDDLVWINCPPPMLILPEIDEVHVSVAFTWDIPAAERLAEMWRVVGVPVKVSGPAYSERGGDFTAGQYIKQGMVITSRGCPNNCWFCVVPKREGVLRELPIVNGYNVLDDNLLACSDAHISSVFEMLSQQAERPIFSGGLEPRRLKPWHVDLLRKARTRRLYCAYDTPDDYEPLCEAGKLLAQGGIPRSHHVAACYVLIGYRGDAFDRAESRLRAAWDAGFVPYAMLYRDAIGQRDAEWARFQRHWIRPEIVMREVIQYA